MLIGSVSQLISKENYSDTKVEAVLLIKKLSWFALFLKRKLLPNSSIQKSISLTSTKLEDTALSGRYNLKANEIRKARDFAIISTDCACKGDFYSIFLIQECIS